MGYRPAATCVTLAVLMAATAFAAAETPAPAESEAGPKVRGVTISTPTSGREWGWDSIEPTMREIRDVGADWVAIHPYAAVRGDGRIEYRRFDPADPPAHLVRPIEEAHRLGLKILIKPHLAYWGSPFRWRGEIEFETGDAWERFWSGYSRWILDLAAATREADGFVVGTELDRTLVHEARWRRLISGVRATTGAPLTYAANWTDYDKVPFWDALDVIGIQAYFPLLDGAVGEDDGDAPRPCPATLAAAWRSRMARLREYAASHNRRVVFTELGYNRSHDAAVRPWDDRLDGPEAEPLQEALLRAALIAVESEPAVAGVFLWKWFPHPRPVGRTFQLATPRLRQAIADVWR